MSTTTGGMGLNWIILGLIVLAVVGLGYWLLFGEDY